MNIENIDIKKTFSEVLLREEYCYSVLRAIKEEQENKPLQIAPERTIDFLLWHNTGVSEFAKVISLKETAINPSELIFFIKLDTTQQKKILYRASLLCKWLFGQRIPPFILRET